MSVHGLTVHLPRFLITVSLNRSAHQRRGGLHASTLRQTTGTPPARREMVQARQMLSWQSLRQ